MATEPEKFVSKYSANEIESMLDKVKQDMQVIQYTQNEINTLLAKIDGITVPTKISDLADDSDFIKNTVNNLTNYYKKTEVYTKEEVNTMVANAASGGFIPVDELPTTNISTKGIYLVPSTVSKQKNIYDEYINLTGTIEGWEIIGDTKINLANYVTTSTLNTTLANYATIEAMNAALSAYATTEILNSTLESYYNKNDIDETFENYYSKTNIDSSFENYYTKSQIDEMLAASSNNDPNNDDPNNNEPNNDDPNNNEPNNDPDTPSEPSEPENPEPEDPENTGPTEPGNTDPENPGNSEENPV